MDVPGCFTILRWRTAWFFHFGPLNSCAQVFVWTQIFFWDKRPGVWLLGCMINCFPSGCTILCSHRQCIRESVSLYLCQHLVVSLFFILAFPVGVKSYLIVLLNCISLSTSDVSCLFMGLFVSCAYLLFVCPLQWNVSSFAHFLVGFSLFWLLSFENSL